MAPVAIETERVTQVRPMRLHEIEALAHGIPETSAAQLANRWREQGLGYRELLAGERAGEAVGTLSIAESMRPVRGMHLFALEVAEAARNQGVGGDIVRWVEDEARRRGLRRVYLEVRIDNPARRLYHRLGYRRVGEPFINVWWRFEDDGTQVRVQEETVRLVHRV